MVSWWHQDDILHHFLCLCASASVYNLLPHVHLCLCSHLYQYNLFLFCLAGWMRTTTLSLMEWTSRTPSSPTLQRCTARFLAFSSFPTARLVLRSTATPQSGRLRRTAGYVAHQNHHHKLVPSVDKTFKVSFLTPSDKEYKDIFWFSCCIFMVAT